MNDPTAELPNQSVTIGVFGPPAFDRVAITGDPESFRWFASMLIKMANEVDDPSSNAHIGWYLVLSGETDNHLRLGDGWHLVLSCNPTDRIATFTPNLPREGIKSWRDGPPVDAGRDNRTDRHVQSVGNCK